MMRSSLVALSLVAAAIAVQAQPATAKKELVARILKLQQPGIEGMARSLVEQPAAELLENAAHAMPSRVPKDKQDAVSKDIQADVKKYLDDAVPLVQARAVKLAPSAIGALLEAKFSEDELKQVVSIIESPVYVKFQKMGDEMQQQLVAKLVADTRPLIEPKVRALEQAIAKRLGATPPAAGAAAPRGPRAPAKPASR